MNRVMIVLVQIDLYRVIENQYLIRVRLEGSLIITDKR